MLDRCRTLAVAAALAAGAVPLAHAQADTWPTKPVRIIVPANAGGGTANPVSRFFADELTKQFNSRFYVENHGGANGNIGATAAAQAAPDGYNFLFSWAGTLAVNQAMYKQMGYDSQRDFAPIGLVADVPNILVVNNDLPIKSVEDFVRHVRANPGKLSYGSTGIGSSMHLAGELYSREYGAQMVHVPFSNPGNATTNLISGEIQLMFQLIPGIASQVKAGRVRAIGVMAAQRSPALPDVPTMVELGAPKLMSSTWFALLAPKGTPAVSLERMNAALNEVLADPAVKKRLSDIGASPLGGTPKQLADHLAAEVDKWGRLVRDAKITVQ